MSRPRITRRCCSPWRTTSLTTPFDPAVGLSSISNVSGSHMSYARAAQMGLDSHTIRDTSNHHLHHFCPVVHLSTTITMVGTLWTKEEEAYFWKDVVPNSLKRLGADIVNHQGRGWEELGEIMLAEITAKFGPANLPRDQYSKTYICMYLVCFPFNL
jgi:hypothetical protein